MDLQTALRGVTPPLVTPFTADGSLDADALSEVVSFVVDRGVSGLFPCGTTGEFASLTFDERLQTIETTVSHAEGVPVLAGVASPNVHDTVAQITAAADAGADVAVVTPPYFHTANAPQGNQAYFEQVAADSELPLLLYNIPSCTGAPIDPETVVALSTQEQFIGLKDSSGDFGYFSQLLRQTADPFLLLQGFDNLLLPSLRIGADGGIHALSNVLPSVFAELAGAPQSDRAAELQQTSIAPLFETCLSVGFAPATKAALSHRSVIPTDAVRPPLVETDAETAETITALVDQATSI